MDWMISRLVFVSVVMENDGVDVISRSGSHYLIAENRDGVPGEILSFMHSPSLIYIPKHTNHCLRQDIEANGFFGPTPYTSFYKK